VQDYGGLFPIFPQGSFDTVVGRLLIPDLAFSGFAVTQTGPAEVTVSEGRLFANGKVFFNNQDGGTPVDMLARLPATTRRIVAITVWGVETDSKARTSHVSRRRGDARRGRTCISPPLPCGGRPRRKVRSCVEPRKQSSRSS
jgi:hypothetical protein